MISMEASLEMFKDAIKLAELLGGTLGFTREGRLVIQLDQSMSPRAPQIAASIGNDQWPWGYVVPENDSTLVFEF